MILLPDGTGTASLDWIAVGEATRHAALADDNGSTSYVKCNDDAEAMIIEFADPSVDEADIASIDSVQFLSSGKAIHRTDPSLVNIRFEAGTASYFVELCSYDAHRTNFETINGTVRVSTNVAFQVDWTYANLEDLEMKCTKALTVEVYLSYLALKVTYTEAVTDNATFFGANF